ncbi:MAG: hypothetical protein HOP23_17520 [Methylococcaceae bacterium]|nr:hypothetical protein [Methylococcaceae bacterium]
MMRFTLFRTTLLICVLHLPACAIKGYSGPDLPNTQLATVSLKAPAASLIPLFWIFPLNLLTWFSEDWYETSWHSGYVKINGKIVLNRFKRVNLVPGPHQVATEKPVVMHREEIGIESCSTSICSCTTDKKNNKTCSQTTSCSTRYRETAHDRICRIIIDAKAGEQYKVFIRDRHLIVNGSDSTQFNDEICSWGADYSYETSSSTSSSTSCNP